MGETSISPCRGSSLTTDCNEPFEIVLGGGGVKGFGHLGFLKAIKEFGVSTSTVTGVSVGSLVGAFYTNGYSEADIAEIFAREIFHIGPKKLFKQLIPDFGRGVGIQPVVVDLIERYNLVANDDLRVIAYNMLKRKPVVFEGTDYDLAVALSASCAVPFLMLPVLSVPTFGIKDLVSYVSGNPQEGILVDGGVHHPCPVEFCQRQAIIAKLGMVSRLPRQFSSVFDVYMHGLELAGASFLNKLFPDSDEHLLIDVAVPDIAALSFGVSSAEHQRMFDFGYAETTRMLSEAGFSR